MICMATRKKKKEFSAVPYIIIIVTCVVLIILSLIYYIIKRNQLSEKTVGEHPAEITEVQPVITTAPENKRVALWYI